MKPLDWILLVVSVLWFLINILRVWVMLDDPRVKYMGAKITITWPFFIPVFMWLFIAWRVGG